MAMTRDTDPRTFHIGVQLYTVRDAIQIIMTVGMSSALVGFGVSERVSMRP